MRHERQHGHQAGEKEAQRWRRKKTALSAEAQVIALQEQYDFKTFAVKRGEAEQAETPEQAGGGRSPNPWRLPAGFLPAIVHGHPAAPVDLMEKPVHDDEQNDDREQAGDGLQGQGRDAIGKIFHDAHGDEPGDQRGDESDARAGDDRLAVRLAFARHAGGDGCENQDAFQALAENEHADVQNRRRRAGIGHGRIRVTTRSDALPD